MAGGAFSGGGGFDVEPLMLVGGSAHLEGAASASAAYGASVATQTSIGAEAMGAGPLAGALGALGGKLDMRAGQLGGSLGAAKATLESSAANYVRSDAPLAGAP